MSTVTLPELWVGSLLAEGGEGQVFEAALPGGRSDALVFKRWRRPLPAAELLGVVGFPAQLSAEAPSLAARVASASAWPTAVVLAGDGGTGRDGGTAGDVQGLPGAEGLAVGVLMPRAPGNFWVSHRDGSRHLATLSYLASDPDRIALAYGARVPPPGAPERVATVYALARLLEAWQGEGVNARASHGDLSAKNVLWSVNPAPAVYVLDCDGAVVTAPSLGQMAGAAMAAGGVAALPVADVPVRPAPAAPVPARPRATTPNWEDPALGPEEAPREASDRYMLGLAFLRIVGAANFPLQGRQRTGARVDIDLELPRSWRGLTDMPELWHLCERSLSVARAGERPSPGQWAERLEDLLDVLGARELAQRARDHQGDRVPSASRVAARAAAPGADPLVATAVVARGRAGAGQGGAVPKDEVPDVTVRPLLRRRPPSAWQLVNPRTEGPAGGLAGGSHSAQGTPSEILRRAGTAWLGAHRLGAALLRSPGRRWLGMRRLGGAVLVDLATGCVVLFLVGMVVSPWIGL